MHMLKTLFTKNTKRALSQEELIEFVLDEKTIDKAVQGSMQKRKELLERVVPRQKHA